MVPHRWIASGSVDYGDRIVLVLTRRLNETVDINGGQILVKVLGICGDRIRLGFEAAENIPIHRNEVAERIREQEREGGSNPAA